MKLLFKTTLFIFILLLPFATKAQFDVGIKGGYGYNRYFFQKNYFEQGFLPVYNGGILFQYLNDRKLGVQSSIEITQKGWEEITIDNGHAQFKMDFVQFDFLALIKFSSKKENGLFIKFGPYAAYSYNSQFTETGNTDSAYFNYDSLQYFYYNLDYGVKIGLSYKIKIKSGSIQLEMLYAQGLYNVFERDATTIFQSINQSLFINLAYTFTLGGNENKTKRKKKKK